MPDPHATLDRAAIKAAILAVWESPEFDNVDDDEGAGMVADAVLALLAVTMTDGRATSNRVWPIVSGLHLLAFYVFVTAGCIATGVLAYSGANVLTGVLCGVGVLLVNVPALTVVTRLYRDERRSVVSDAHRVRLYIAYALLLAGAWIDPERKASMREVRSALKGRERL